MWEEAYDVAIHCPEGVAQSVENDFMRRAEAFVQDENFREAERLFCAMMKPDLAIQMYNTAEM